MWASQMRALLITQDRLDRCLDAAPTTEDGEARDVLCKAKLQLHVAGALQSVVARAKTAHAAWKALEDDYKGSLATRQPQLMGRLHDLSQGRDSVVEYIDRAMRLRDQFEELDMGGSMPLLCSAFVRGLNDDIRLFCGAGLHTVMKKKDYELDDVAAELRSLVLMMPERRGRANATKASGARGGRREDRQCFYCKEVGHIARNCPKKKKDAARQRQGGSDDGTVLAVTAPRINGLVGREDTIWLDSGATHHVVQCEGLLKRVREPAVSKVLLGGGEEHYVQSEGDLRLTGGPNGPVTLTGVLCIPTLGINLASVPQLTKKQASVAFDKGARITDSSGKLLLKAHLEGDMYRIECDLPGSSARVNATVTAEVWHKRLGHVSEDTLRKMASGDAVTGMGEVTKLSLPNHCDVCDKSKQTRETFKRSDNRATAALELVHCDVMGPFPCDGIDDERYVVTALDDFSRMSEVACLRRKSDVAEAVIDLLLRWQRQSGAMVKRVRTDRGSEFMAALDEYLRRKGIVHETSVAYAPEQNGRAERLNRTLMERTRALLHEHGLPKMVWSEAIKAASHLRNLVPGGAESKTPHELFYGTKPDVGRLRVYGCKVSAHVPKHLRDKLDSVSEECALVGYAEHSKAYRLLTRGHNGSLTVIEAVNVRVHESERASFLRADGDSEANSVPEWDDEVITILHSRVPGVPAPEMAAEPAQEDVAQESGVAASEESGEGGAESGGASEDEPGELGDNEEPAERRYPARERRPPARWYEGPGAQLHAIDGLTDQPATYKEAMSRPDAELWKEAINSEMASLTEKGVYEEVSLPPGKRALPSKLVFAIKRHANGEIDKYKSRLVAKGFNQIAGRDYDEVFAPTAQHATLRILVALAAWQRLDLDQMDVKTAFLNGDLEEEVFLRLPQELGGRVWRLHKALYGLKQAAFAWHQKLRKEMARQGFTASEHDPCLFMTGSADSRVYVLVHVDDALVVGREEHVRDAKQRISKCFEVKDLGPASCFLRLEIRRGKDGSIALSQEHYAKEIVERFDMAEAKPKPTPLEVGANYTREDGTALPESTPYSEVVGSLMYLACNTRPDLCHSMGVLTRFMAAPSTVHWEAAKRVLRYLRGTTDLCIKYQGGTGTGNQGVPSAVTFCDADHAADKDKRRSTTGTVITFNGRAVAWFSKLQSVVATSTTEAEYIAAAHGAKEGLWIRKLLGEIEGTMRPVMLKVDNQSAIKLVKQHTAGQPGRTKHIDVQYHFLKDRYQRGDISISYVETKLQRADVFTKQLPGPAFKEAIKAIMG